MSSMISLLLIVLIDNFFVCDTGETVTINKLHKILKMALSYTLKF
jgi:hypothetical protein